MVGKPTLNELARITEIFDELDIVNITICEQSKSNFRKNLSCEFLYVYCIHLYCSSCIYEYLITHFAKFAHFIMRGVIFPLFRYHSIHRNL